MANATAIQKGFTRDELFPLIERLAFAVMTSNADSDSPQLGVHIMSSPGLGKSAMARDVFLSLRDRVAEKLGCDVSEIVYCDLMAPNLDPMDPRGLPVTEREGKGADAKTVTVWTRPNILPPLNAKAAFIFIDEIDKALLAVKNVLAQIVYEKRAGEHKLPERTFIMLASNLLTDRAGGSAIPTHWWNRMANLTMTYDVQASIAYYAGRGHDPSLLSFLHDHSDLLYTFNAKSDNPSFATLRTWDEFGRYMKILPLEAMNIWGGALVGDAACAAFKGHMDLYRLVPDFAQLRSLNPDAAAAKLKSLPPSAQYASISKLCAAAATPDDVDWMVLTFEQIAPDYASAAANWLTNVNKKYAITFRSKQFQKYSATTGVALNS